MVSKKKNIKQYPWLYLHFEKLISAYLDKQKNHALLIQTLPGNGDDILVYELICFVLCQQPLKQNSCGECRSCRLMQLDTHPDYHALIPEKNKNKISINIVREISERLHKSAQLGREKVVFLNDVTLLTEEAASAFLKLLEDLPRNTWVFFSCFKSIQLLIELRSRCQVYHLTTPQEFSILPWLEQKTKLTREIVLTALRLSSGAPMAALFLLDPRMWLKREKLCILLKVVIENHDWLSLLIALNHDQVVECLHWLALILLDALKIKQNVSLLSNIDCKPMIETIALNFSNTILLTILYDICKCRNQILSITGINRELLLTNCLLRVEYYLKLDEKIPFPSFSEELCF